MQKTIKEFWETKHKEDNAGSLTGSQGGAVWTMLGVNELVKPEAVVLNIGIGLGFCTKELVHRGCATYVLDISQTAVDRVKDVVKGYWLATDVGKIPGGMFDVVVSNLVAQHMSDEDFQKQLNVVVKSLKHEGVFAIQVAAKLDGKEHGKEDLQYQMAGAVCRKLSKMCQMVEKAGGMITSSKRSWVNKQFKSMGYALHIQIRKEWD